MSKELKEMMHFVVAMGSALGKALADGKVGLADVMALVQAGQAAPEAFAGVAEIPSELALLSEEDKAAVMKVIEGLDLPNDQHELVAEKLMKMALYMAEVIFLFKAPKAVPAVGEA